MRILQQARYRVVIASAAGLALVGALAGCAAPTPAPTVTVTASPTPAAKLTLPTTDASKDLTVTVADLVHASVKARCLTNVFIPNSLPNGDFVVADAVSTQFKGPTTDPNGLRMELLTEQCGNPTLLYSTISALSTVPTDDGKTVGFHNPWMAQFLKATETESLNALYLRKKSANSQDIFVTTQYQQYAEMTNVLLLRPLATGVFADLSQNNWFVPDRAGMVAGELPIPVLNTVQENRLALRLTYTLKVGGCLFAIDFNYYDKRAETTTLCQSPPPKTKCTGNSCITVVCTTVGGCKPLTCEQLNGGKQCKNELDDPVQHHNAQTGGGRNADPGPGAPLPVTQPPGSPRVNPTTPTASPSPSPSASPSPDPAPAPAPETSAAPPSNPSQTCSPAPGMTSC